VTVRVWRSRRLLRCLAVLGVSAATWLWPGPVSAQDEIPVTLRAKSFQYDRATRRLVASGDVVVTYQDVTIKADRLEANLETNDVRAEGQVTIEVAGQQIRCASLEYNLTTRRGRLRQSAAEYTGPLVLGTVFLRAEVVEGTLGAATTARQAFCTTCEGPNPVTYLTAQEITVYPNDKIVGRRVTVWIGGRRVFTWPYFVIHIRERRASRLLPVVGYSEAEGYFLKTFYSYAINPNHYGYLRLDLMERLGIGYGVEHAYRLRAGEGVAFLYRLENRQIGGVDSRVVVAHQQRLGEVAARAYVDHTSRTSPVAPSATLFASLDAYHRGARSATTLYQTYASTDFAGFASTFYSGRLIQFQQLTGTLSAEFVADVSRATSGLGTDDELLPRLTLHYRGPTYTASLVAEARLDLDGPGFLGDIRFMTERLPELTVIRDPVRIRGTRLTLQPQVGLGRFRETQAIGTVEAVRADVAASVSGLLAETEQGTLTLQTQVRGSHYSTGDLRAFVSGRVDYAHTFSTAWHGQMGLTYQDQAGRTPFLFDQTSGRVAQADGTLTYRRPNLLATATAAYDVSSGLWTPPILRALYSPRPGWIIAGALAYDPAVATVSRAELALEIKFDANWQLTYYGFFDGFSGQVFHDQLTITRTWYDCLVTAVTYRGVTRELWVETWLTALPWARGQIGIGAQGTLLFQQPFVGPRP
jgi:hypothetical protein